MLLHPVFFETRPAFCMTLRRFLRVPVTCFCRLVFISGILTLGNATVRLSLLRFGETSRWEVVLPGVGYIAIIALVVAGVITICGRNKSAKGEKKKKSSQNNKENNNGYCLVPTQNYCVCFPEKITRI